MKREPESKLTPRSIYNSLVFFILCSSMYSVILISMLNGVNYTDSI